MFRKLHHRIADRCAAGRHAPAPTRCARRWSRPISTNPTLTAQRETLEGDRCRRSRSPRRPDGRRSARTVGLNRDLTRSGVLDHRRQGTEPLGRSVDLSVPLFNGGAVRNSIAGRQDPRRGRPGDAARGRRRRLHPGGVGLHGRDPRPRDRRIEPEQREGPETNLEATRDRFQIGDLTRTDVAQSEARLQLGRSQLATAAGRLDRERSHLPPGDRPCSRASSRRRRRCRRFPATADEAVRIALANNPDLIAITRQAVAAGYDVQRRAGGPPADALGRAERHLRRRNSATDRAAFPTTGTHDVDRPQRAGPDLPGRPAGGAHPPGAGASRARCSSRSSAPSARSSRRPARPLPTYDAAQKAIQANTVAVQANELALEGTRAEQSVGTRTVLDVLNAEQELLNSQVALVTAKRDAYVAGFQLLNAMGQAEAEDLGLDGGPLYDPLGNYRRVANELERLGERSAPRPGRDPDGHARRRCRQPGRHARTLDQLRRGRSRRATPVPATSGVTPPQQ